MTEESKSDNNTTDCLLYEIDIDNQINYTKIVDDINDRITNNSNEFNLILSTKLDTICQNKGIYITFKESIVCIKINLYEDNDWAINFNRSVYKFDYYIPNLTLKNNISTKKTEYLLIIRFCIIVIRYMILDSIHSNSEDFIKIYQEINKYLSIHVITMDAITLYYNNFINARNDWRVRESAISLKYKYLYTKKEMREFLELITIDLENKKKEDMIATRSIKSILGNFEEQISPSMIHKILTWLKKKK